MATSIAKMVVESKVKGLTKDFEGAVGLDDEEKGEKGCVVDTPCHPYEKKGSTLDQAAFPPSCPQGILEQQLTWNAERYQLTSSVSKNKERRRNRSTMP